MNFWGRKSRVRHLPFDPWSTLLLLRSDCLSPWLGWFAKEQDFHKPSVLWAEAIRHWPEWKERHDGPLVDELAANPRHHQDQSYIVGDYYSLTWFFRGWIVATALLRDDVPKSISTGSGTVAWLAFAEATNSSIRFEYDVAWSCIYSLRRWREIKTVSFGCDFRAGDSALLEKALGDLGAKDNYTFNTTPPKRTATQIAFLGE